MFRTKRKKAEIIEIISCDRHKSVMRDYYAEKSAGRYGPYRYLGEQWCTRYNNFNCRDLEEKNEGYSILCADYHTKKNEWTGEFELYREEIWFAIKLKIKYTVSGVTYKKDIAIHSHTKEVKEITVYYEKKNPEIIDDIISI